MNLIFNIEYIFFQTFILTSENVIKNLPRHSFHPENFLFAESIATAHLLHSGT